MVPLAPSWVTAEKTMTTARLVPVPGTEAGDGAFEIQIHRGVSAAELKAAKTGTVRSSRLECPHCGESTAISAIRGDRRGGGASEYGLRQWENSDLVPRPGDTFQERLYCIRWRLPDLAALISAEQHERAGLAADRPVPDWVLFDRAIDGLAALLGASDRMDLAALRARDWLGEDARLDTAGADLAVLRAAKAPKARIDAQNKVLVALITAQAERVAESPIERIIEDAVRTASNFLVPNGIDAQLWKRLTPEEKLYLKCLEVESHGDYRSGVFMEFARGFGVRDYRFMLESGKANPTRLKTATEFKRREWGIEGFGSSLLRHALFAVYQTADQDSTKVGLSYLKTEIRDDYWTQRPILVEMIGFLGRLPMPPWAGDAEAARLLAGALANDHV